MHELPTALQLSLRGWRGSVRLSQGGEEALFDQAYLNHDPELGSADPFGLRHHESSLILHPTASRRPLQDNNLSIPSYQNPQQQQQQQQQTSRYYNPPSNDKTSSSYSSYHHHHHHHRNKNDASSFSTSDSTDSEDPLSPSEIYTLLGMRAPTPPTPPTQNHSSTTPKPKTSKPKKNKDLESLQHGLYATMLRKESRVSRHYRLYDILIITLMILQLCISAVFIVLGSLPHIDSHIAVAALGAVSTMVAGVLALMKGQGLPNRLRMERDGLRRVIFETEELYWDARAGREVDFGDVCRLREAYVGVVDDARKNHPDVWTASPVAVGGKTPAGLRKARIPGALQVAKL